MIRYFLGTHNRKSAWGAGIAATITTFLVGTGLMISSQWRNIVVAQDAVAVQVNAIRDEIRIFLKRLNSDFDPSCSEENLLKIRKYLFTTRFIGDVGVFDEQGRLACTTTLSALSRPVVVRPPDISIVQPDGMVIHSNFQSGLLVAPPSTRSIISQAGRFNAVVYPHALSDLQLQGVSAVQMVAPDGRRFTATRRDDLPASWVDRLQTRDYTSDDFQRFDWEGHAFVAARRVVGTPYIAQTIVTLDDFRRKYASTFAITFWLALLIGVLVYQAVTPILKRWQALGYRITSLLNEGNLVCNYQPIIDLRTGQPVGCEVLMRLRDGKSVLPPDVVIPAIIARKLTWQLDAMVVRKAVKELSGAVEPFPGFKVAFNLFPDNVVASKIQSLFQDIRIDRASGGIQFEIEVIEQQYKDSIVSEIAELRAHGFLVSVDDFGTGYSNLGSVKAISPDFLKIDRSFVKDMEDESLRSTLIPEIVAIGRAVGAQIIAEGIENECQMQRLMTMGVEFGQGYFFAKPQPIEAFTAYLVAHRESPRHVMPRATGSSPRVSRLHAA